VAGWRCVALQGVDEKANRAAILSANKTVMTVTTTATTGETIAGARGGLRRGGDSGAVDCVAPALIWRAH